MINQNSTWRFGFIQKMGLETDQERVKQIIKEQHQPIADKIEKAIRLSESINDRDKNLVLSKRQLIDLVLMDSEQAEKMIKQILVLNKGKLNGFVSHIRQELKS